MNLAWVSLLALLMIILASHWERVNVGVLAIAAAWMIGSYGAEMTAAEIFQAFPISLFMVLFGVTFFFGLAQANGTLDRAVHSLFHCVRGRRSVLPLIFFALSLVLAAIGPGNIGAVALLAPLAMAAAGKTGISAFFMTVMLVTGANAGTFSPFSPTGIIADGLTARLGMAMDPWTQVFLPSLLVQSFIAFGCYVVLIELRRRRAFADPEFTGMETAVEPFNRHQAATVLMIGVFILGVTAMKMDIGFFAIGLAALLMLIGASRGPDALKSVPWNVIMMVCGVSMLINIMGKTGGLDLFTTFLAKISNPRDVTGVIALISGIISVYSSSSGVVMPAFIPIVPGLIEKMGGGDPVALVAAINVGSHVVDVSPLSTLGALCLASAAKHEDKAGLFRRQFFFGLSMSLAGAVICYVFFGALGRWFVIG